MNASARKPTRVQITERGKIRNGQEKNGEERQGETRGALEADLGRLQDLPSEGGRGEGRAITVLFMTTFYAQIFSLTLLLSFVQNIYSCVSEDDFRRSTSPSNILTEHPIYSYEPSTRFSTL